MALAPSHQRAPFPVMAKIPNTDNGKAAHPPTTACPLPLSNSVAVHPLGVTIFPLQAPKKLIRYIDNQVVSTKGERYKDIKKPESEEMKRTYISLKPARKYKFH